MKIHVSMQSHNQEVYSRYVCTDYPVAFQLKLNWSVIARPNTGARAVFKARARAEARTKAKG